MLIFSDFVNSSWVLFLRQVQQIVRLRLWILKIQKIFKPIVGDCTNLIEQPVIKNMLTADLEQVHIYLIDTTTMRNFHFFSSWTLWMTVGVKLAASNNTLMAEVTKTDQIKPANFKTIKWFIKNKMTLTNVPNKSFYNFALLF